MKFPKVMKNIEIKQKLSDYSKGIVSKLVETFGSLRD